MELISHKEAIETALKNPYFNVAYKKINYRFILSKTIYKIRKEQKLTQEEFTKKHKINYLKLLKIEFGDCENIKLKDLENFLEKLGLYMSIELKNFSEDLED